MAEEMTIKDAHQSNSKKKLTWLLILQGWTMLWVVIGHGPLKLIPNASQFDSLTNEFARALFTFAYSFHMPLFIMISGYLFHKTRIFKEWQWGRMMKEKLVRLGIPYVIFITLAIIVKWLSPSGGVSRSVTMSWRELPMNYLYPFEGALQEMWFVAVILIYFLMYPVYQYLLRNRWTIMATIIISVSMHLFIQAGLVSSFFAFNRALIFFVFFFIGTVISAERLESFLGKYSTAALFGLVFIIASITRIKFIMPLSGCLFFWGCSMIVDEKLTHSIFSSFRNYTYQIFLMGIFVQIFFKIVYGRLHMPDTYWIFYISNIVAGLYVPVLISKMIEKCQWTPLRKTIGV